MKSKSVYFIISMLIGLALACSTLSGNDPDNLIAEENTSEGAAPTPTATRQVSTDTPLPSDAQQVKDELPPLSYEEILEAGIEAGDWTREEGLVLFLKYFAGELGADEMPGVEDVVVKSGSVIIGLADAYLEQADADPQTQAEIARLLRILFPPQEVLDAISLPEDEAGAVPSSKLASMGQPAPLAQTEEEDCINLAQGGYDPEEVQGQVCLLIRERVVSTRTTVQVYFPVWTEDSEEIFTTINTLLNILEESAIAYKNLNGLTLENFNFLYLPYDFLQLNIPIMVNIDNNTDTCIMTHVWATEYPEAVQQSIAMEMFNCVLRWTYGDNSEWWKLGTPLYFSNVIYPQGDLEWGVVPHFDRYSVDTSLEEMGRANFVFFQFLGNVYSPQTVVDIMDEMNSSSAFEWFSYIASGTPGDFTSFVVDYLSRGIADENTGAYFISPSPARVTDTISIDEVGEYTLESEFLVARRYFVNYKEEKRFLQVERDSDSETSNITGVESKLQWSRGAWSALPPEIRSECDDDVRYLYVPTFRILADHRYNQNTIQVTTAEQAVCDPCLLGAWKVDNLSFAEYMEGIFAENVPEVSNFVTFIDGDYFLQFDTEGKMQAQRENLSVYYGLESTFNEQPTLNPEAPGPQPTQSISVPVNGIAVINSNGIGNYSADGEIMKVTQFVDVVENSTAGVGLGGSGFFGAIGRFEGAGDVDPMETAPYTCEGDILEISMPYYDSILRLNRVEQILPTPVPTPSQYDDSP